VRFRSGSAFNISHLLFVDDTLFFPGQIQIIFVDCLFLCFEAVLGLRINLAEMVPIGHVTNVEEKLQWDFLWMAILKNSNSTWLACLRCVFQIFNEG
jgi:hypothetical protein